VVRALVVVVHLWTSDLEAVVAAAAVVVAFDYFWTVEYV
jgi:hypothetical protein